MPRTSFITASALALALPIAAHAQTGGFLVTLGMDTVAIERYMRSGRKLEGTVVNHFANSTTGPSTRVLKYTATFNIDGTAATYEQATYRADGAPMPGVATGLRMTFTGDSVIREMTPPTGQPATFRAVAPKGTLPGFGGSQMLYQLGIQRAKKDGSGAFNVYGFGPTQTAPAKVVVRFFGSDSAEVEAGAPYYTGYRFDRAGRLTHGDGAKSTQKFIITPLKNVDVAGIANAWAVRDAAGHQLGVMSPTDTLKARAGAANIQIVYSRPGKRGRHIWGGVVPWNEVWRFGANAATMFTTDKDLDIGGTTVPAGTYTLFLLPTQGQSLLIVNKETKQWGTDYHADQDLVRIPVETHMGLPTVDERFTLSMAGDKLMFHWDNGGYGVKVSAR